ncbi:MAG TPA: ABC transporter ATP-binding protein [Anaerolineales bacterium]|nr:ABC transporter ATP-binding protein [Anaerolineales bacterium]
MVKEPAGSSNLAVETEKLGRIYRIHGSTKEKNVRKELVALQDVDLQVKQGELFGLLGPNGAGKTTLIKILTTLLAPNSGRARVAGFDVAKEPGRIRPLINMVSGGESSGYGLLTVRENLWMFSQFYGLPSKQAYQRIDALLKIVGLEDRIHTKSSDLSTGLRQKMNIVRGFLTDPQVLFLDEPTLGLDVGASRDVRNLIRDWLDQDKTRTLLLTTHYMVEADELCDRVAIINHGRVLAFDTPSALKQGLQGEAAFEITVSSMNGLDAGALERLPGIRKMTRRELNGFTALNFSLQEEAALAGIINGLTESNVKIMRLDKHEPTLEDVFVNLVGRSMAEIEKEESDDEQAESAGRDVD